MSTAGSTLAAAGAKRPAGTSPLVDAPIVPTILRLATPSVVLALFQTAVSVADTHFIGRLGTDSLAGLALAFPLVMLLQMLSAGAMGGGVSSAIARALGANDRAQARNLVVHALVIALVAGTLFTLLLVTAGGALYELLGGRDVPLAQALRYSDTLFAGAVFVWLANTLASALRGSGNTLAPAIALVIAALVQIPLSGALTLGWGPFPQLGIRGAAIAYVVAFAVSTFGMAAYLVASPLRPQRGDTALARLRFREILRVGAFSSLGALQTVLTAVLLTGFAASFGAAALAGYGVGVRLELLQVPIVFAIGQALVVLVGTHVGARMAERAKAIAWTGMALAMLVCLAIGVTVAVFPAAWVGLFSQDPDVVATGGLYLRIVAPVYPFFAAGLALYFAAQGAGHIVWPMLAGTARLSVVALGGVIVAEMGLSLGALFAVIDIGLVTLGALTALAVYRTPWQR
jgi:putative MATE family efflux protein